MFHPVARILMPICVMLLCVEVIAPALATKLQSDTSVGHTELVTVVLIPHQEALFSAEISTGVLKIHKQFGESFIEGDLLIELDATVFQADFVASEAQLAAADQQLQQVQQLLDQHTDLRRAQAVLKAAQTDLESIEKLYTSNNASQRDLEHARRDLTVAQTQLEQIQASRQTQLADARRELAQAMRNVELARKNLDACTIKAPYPGRVVDVYVHEHEMIERTMPLVEIVNDHKLIAKFLLPSEMFQQIDVGRALTITITELGTTVSVVVTNISARMDPASMTFEVRGEVDNPNAKLRAGMTGTLSLNEFD